MESFKTDRCLDCGEQSSVDCFRLFWESVQMSGEMIFPFPGNLPLQKKENGQNPDA